MHLDERNEARIANANYLTRELSKIPGVIPPYCPPECKHVYFLYNVRFDPRAAGIDCEPRRFRIAVEKGLYMEGALVGQWQTVPVPAQDIFQSKLGYGGSSYPWAVNEARGIKYTYHIDDYPVAKELCDTYTIVHGIHPPNSSDLMAKIVGAFHKVFSNLGQALDHANDAIYPGADGKLYGAG